MTSSDSIDARDVPDEGQGRGDVVLPAVGAQSSATAAPAAVPPELAWSHVPTLQEFKSVSERAYLVAKLRENGWNISKTAEVIDTPRSNLYKKLEQYQISEETDGR